MTAANGRYFTALDVLGRTINANKTQVNPLDANNVLAANSNVQVIKFGSEHPFYFPGSSFAVGVPENVGTAWIDKGTGTTYFAKSGDEMRRQLEVDLKIEASYMAVTAKAGANFSYEDKYKSDTMYCVINNSSDLYETTLKGTHREILASFTASIMGDIRKLPSKFDDADSADLEKYHAFVQLWGTHIVTQAAYGTRYQAMIEEKTSEIEQAAKFKINVEAEYAGVIGKGTGSVDVTGSQEYKTYTNTRSESHTIMGGDPIARNVLQQTPFDPTALKTWAESEYGIGNEILTHMNLIPISEFIEASDDATLKSIGAMLANYVAYANFGVLAVPNTNNHYGPCMVVHPISEAGEAIVTLSSDENAEMKKIADPPGWTLSADGKELRYAWTARQPAETFNFNLRCGSRTDIKINVHQGAADVIWSTTYSQWGWPDSSSPYTYYIYLRYKNDGTTKYDLGANLAKRGGKIPAPLF